MSVAGSTWLRRDDEKRKLARKIVTPEGVPLELTLAAAGDRAVAFAIDMVIQIAVTLVIALAFNYASGGASTSWLAPFVILFVFLLVNFYFAFFELRWQGTTPGKRKVGLRVVDARGGQLTASAVLARNLTRELEVWTPLRFLVATDTTGSRAPGWMLLLAGMWTFVFMLMPLFNKDKLRVGDLVAGTRVVRVPATVLLPDLAGAAPHQAAAAHRFTEAQLGIYGVYELHVLEDVLRARPDAGGRVDAMAAVAEKIRIKIDYTERALDDEAFLCDFYSALRAHLEQKLLFGQRREDKFARK